MRVMSRQRWFRCLGARIAEQIPSGSIANSCGPRCRTSLQLIPISHRTYKPIMLRPREQLVRRGVLRLFFGSRFKN